MGDETPSKAQDQPPDAEAADFSDINFQVQRHFKGDWNKFLIAVANPIEILHFILSDHFGMDTDKFEAWAKEEKLPDDYIPRFYTALTPEGEIKPEFLTPADAGEGDEAEAKSAEGESKEPSSEG